MFDPYGVKLDENNNIFIADTGNNVIRMIEANTGIIHTIVGNGNRSYSGDNGSATHASLSLPRGIVIKGNHVYIADTGNHRIRLAIINDKIITIAGTGDPDYNGDNDLAVLDMLYSPSGLALDVTNNLLYIADSGNNR